MADQQKRSPINPGEVLARARLLPKALALVWQAARRWTFLWLILLLIQGLLPVAVVYLTRSLVDRLVPALSGDGSWDAFVRGPLIPAVLLAAAMVLIELLRAVTRWVRTAQSELVRDHITDLIHDRALAADVAYYESPDYYDMLYRAQVDAQNRPVALVENLGALLQGSLTLVAMAAVLVPFGWWIPLALLLSTAPALWVVARFAVRQHRWQTKSTDRRRRAWYFDWLITSRDAVSEVRLFDLGSHFRNSYQQLRSRLRSELLQLSKSQALAESFAGGFALLVMGATLVWMLLRAVRGEITLGSLAMFYQAFAQGQRLMRSLLETVGQVYSNVLFLGNLFEFLEVEPQIIDSDQPEELKLETGPSISFKNVAFAYPSSDRRVFDDFNLEIEGGSMVALLGVNGAGKSTLFKLLCRLYDPEIGAVEVAGQDVRNVRRDDLRRLITVLFQEPVHYSESVRANIELGDLTEQHEDEAIHRALEQAGASRVVENLPDGLDTLLGTWFSGGAELSVGEWQRIALSRAFLREAPIVLLDEPTSALDSWSEIDWIKRFRKLAQGRTVIVITHRLTTARSADVIHVMDRGTIVESGSHEKLLQEGGRYADAWTAQMGRT
ncbi:MAG: ABC transporter ATP-binding protein [bacterium]|nr:ABC transporter ATP-binding protein [bacterium]